MYSAQPLNESQEFRLENSQPTQGERSVIPAISVTQASPTPTQPSAAPSHLDVPGRFPDDDSDASAAGSSYNIPAAASSAHRSEVGPRASGPTAQASDLLLETHAPAAALAGEQAPAEQSDSESSIYSDAYEDLSELEGDGFQSLNAVLESPLRQSSQPEIFPTQQKAVTILSQDQEEAPPPTRELNSELSATSTVVASQPAQEIEADWEKAKAYWRSLTAEKRAQLEKEATEDAAVDGDLEEAKSVTKPKKKKSVERRNSERRALAVHMAQQIAAQQQQHPRHSTHHERSYMIKPGTKWAVETEVATAPTLRTTMRSPPPEQQRSGVSAIDTEGPRLRKSMRPNGSATGGGDSAEHSVRPLSSKAQRPAVLTPARLCAG